MDYLTGFTLDSQHYAITNSIVERVIRAVEISQLPNHSHEVLGIINMHGRIIPVINIRHHLGLQDLELEPHHYLMVCQIPPFQLAFVVDEIIGTFEYQTHDLTQASSILNHQLVQHTIKREGKFIFILNLTQILKGMVESQISHYLIME